jgi:hypothetical protein
MDWSHEGKGTGGSVGRVSTGAAEVQGTHQPSSPRPVMVLSGPQRIPSRPNLPCPSPKGMGNSSRILLEPP